MSEFGVERRGPVLVMTIERPAVRNSIDFDTAEAIAAACETLDTDRDLTVGVITGSGGYFSSGMDLKAFGRDGRPPRIPGRGFAGIVEKPPSKPMIAAVEGFALAGGLEIALACDLIVASRGARFGLPEATRGLVPSAGGMLRLPTLIPRNAALEMIFTGDPVDAERMAELGLVNRLSEPGAALEEALAIAERIGRNAPLSLATAKRVVLEAPSWDAAEAWTRQRAISEPVFSSEDAREGATAFAEKREPRWQGR